jgi:anaerobic magnesium-protoporphyrin IX monomethyl ester cyclase
VDELEHLHTVYGVNVAMLADETPTVSPERWREILRLLAERRLDLDLLMETRADDILRDAHLLPLYRKAGVDHIYVGVESVRQDNLDLFQKELRVEDSRRAIELINQADIVSETSLVLGMPDETVSSIQQTVELAIHYNPDMAFFLAIAPWPYAEIYESLRPHIEVFDYRSYNLVTPVVKPLALTRQELSAEMDRAHKKFYMQKIRGLDAMTSSKRAFMVSVMDLLVHHSYLGEKMRAMAEDADHLPPEMEAIFQGLARREAGLSGGGK